MGIFLQTNHCQKVHRATKPLTFRVFVAEVHRKQDIFHQAQHREKLEKLENNPQVVPAPTCLFALSQRVNIHTPNKDFPFGWTIDARDHVHQGGFAAARLADNTHKFACIEIQGDILQRRKLSCGIFVDLGDILKTN